MKTKICDCHFMDTYLKSFCVYVKFNSVFCFFYVIQHGQDIGVILKNALTA